MLATFSHIFSYWGLIFFEHYSKLDFSDNFQGSSIYIGNVVSTIQNKHFFSHFSHFLAILATSGRLETTKNFWQMHILIRRLLVPEMSKFLFFVDISIKIAYKKIAQHWRPASCCSTRFIQRSLVSLFFAHFFWWVPNYNIAVNLFLLSCQGSKSFFKNKYYINKYFNSIYLANFDTREISCAKFSSFKVHL